MTLAEAYTYRDTLESALLTGVESVTLNDRTVVYRKDMQNVLSRLNRDILARERADAGQTNPEIKTPSWNA
jgi:hypothetical protein